MRSDAQKQADARLAKKLVRFSVQYQLHELEEGEKVKAYLSKTNQSANTYIKKLIRDDMKNWQ